MNVANAKLVDGTSLMLGVIKIFAVNVRNDRKGSHGPKRQDGQNNKK